MAVSRATLPLNLLRKEGVSEENRDTKKTALQFIDRFNGADASVDGRRAEATTMVNEYYDLVTDFYEYGWGQAFHFAPRFAGESFYESLARHEFFLAHRAGFKAGDRLIDVGCGVGGPLRNMVRFTGAHITGINNNAYQISRARRYDERFGLANLTDYVRADFNNMPLEANAVDGAYAIEATCHAADKVRCFSEVLRVLKPGAYFVGYEWVMTPKYDANNEEHRRVKHGIELGDALPDLETGPAVDNALRAAGFELVDSFDVVERYESGSAKNTAWYNPLQGSYTSIVGWKSTPIGRCVTMNACKVLEALRLAPKGSHHAAEILEEAALNLVRGGELQIFTPCYFFLARKPLA